MELGDVHGLILERADDGVGLRGTGRQFKHLRGININGLHPGGRIAQGQDAFLGRPRGPTIDLAVGGSAAHPVGVHQRVGVGARPFGGIGEVVPVLLREKIRGHVHFLQLGAVAKEGADFRPDDVVGVVVQTMRALGIDDAVEHEGVQRIEIAAADHFVMHIIILVGNPAFAFGGGAIHKGMVFAAAPDGIRIKEPERRGPSAGGLVDVDVGPQRAQFGDEFQHGLEIAQARAGVVIAIHTNAVELEHVDAVIGDNIDTQRTEAVIVFRTGHGEIAIAGFIAEFLAKLDAFLVGFAIAAPGREPDAGRGAVLGGGGLHGGEAVRKAGVKLPQGLVVVPAVVEQEGIQFHAALHGQFLAEGVDDIQRALLIVLVEVAKVVPGIIMQIGPVGMGAFAFEIGEEIAAELTGADKADDERAIKRFTGFNGRAPGQEAADIAHFRAIDGKRMFHAVERGGVGHGRAIHRAGGMGGDIGGFQQADRLQGKVGFFGREINAFAEITGTFMQQGVPGDVQIAIAAHQLGNQFLTGQAVGVTRGGGIDRERHEMRLAAEFEIARMQDVAVGEHEAENIGAKFDDLAGLFIRQLAGQEFAPLRLAGEGHLVIGQGEFGGRQTHEGKAETKYAQCGDGPAIQHIQFHRMEKFI